MNSRNSTNFYNIIFGILIITLIAVKCEEPKEKRTAIITKNPDCSNCDQINVNIIYIKSSSKSDVLHYLFSGGNLTRTLSVLIMRSTDLNSNLKINWTKLENITSTNYLDDIVILNGNNYTSKFGLIFTRLFQYEDTADTVKMESTNWFTLNFDQFEWDLVGEVKMNSINFVSRKVSDSNSVLFSKNGNISLKFSYKDTEEFNSEMPRLQYNNKNIQFKLVLQGLKPDVPKPRFGVEFALINSANIESMYIDEVASMNDETSPGVFRVLNFLGQNSKADVTKKTYVQWKPVCYTKDNDLTLNSISVAKNISLNKISKLSPKVKDVIKSSLLYSIFGEHILWENNSMSLINITYGTAGDKFYGGYLSWYASYGYGSPPVNDISLTIILIIIFGLGLPFLMVIAGSIYLIVKKRLNSNASNRYVTIDEHIN